MLVPNFGIIITKPFPAALILSPFRFYGDILKLVYTTSLCGATVRAESLLIGIETTLTECDLQITMCRI